MKNLLEDLQKLIAEQIDLYKKLLLILKKENKIILSSSVDELNVNNKKKEVLLLQIKLLDESCVKLLEKVSQGLPESIDITSIPKLIKAVKEPYFTPLKFGYSKLLSLAKAVKNTNIDNERIIKGSLRAIRSSISFLMTCASSSGPFYENRGQLKTDNAMMQIFEKEA